MSKLKAAEKTFEYFLERLLKGFRSVENREPNNLEMILIKQEAGQKAADANKVIQFPYKKSFGEEVDEMIAKGEVNVGTADKTPPYQKSQADIEFEIMEKIKADNEKAIKAFESRNPKSKTTDVDKAIDNVSPGFSNDRKYDAQLVADDLAEKRFGKEFYDLDQKQQMDLYDEAYQGLSKQRFKQQKEAKPISEPTKKFRLNKERFKQDFNVTDEEVEKISLLSPEDQQKKVREYIDKDFKERIELSDYDVTDLKPNAEGGIVGYYTGGMVDVEPNLSDIGHGSDSLMARTRLVAPDGQATTSTGLNYLLAEDNDNIRVPFSKGKLADAARRKFMKTVGGIGAGIGALKTGLIGLGEKAGPKVEMVTETVKEYSAPALDKIVETVMSVGDLISQSGRRLKELTTKKKFKDIEVEEDMMDGPSYTIKKDGETIYYRPGRQDETGGFEEDIIEVIDETTTKKASGGVAKLLGE